MIDDAAAPHVDLEARIRVHEVQLLSDDWYVLKKTQFSFLRSDGVWQEQSRETYDRGDGATILLFDPQRRTVVLVRQFRYPAYVNGHRDLLIEAPAGLLDERGASDAIRAELMEETGFEIAAPRPIFQVFMSPGSVTERLHFFVAEYGPGERTGAGGGAQAEGEDIEVLELPFDRAVQMIDGGQICDGKTIMLLQYAALRLFV